MCTDRYLVTVYLPTTRDEAGHFPPLGFLLILNKGKLAPRARGEGELYDLAEDPRQRRNLWSDPVARPVRVALVEALLRALPAGRAQPPAVQAPL